MKSCTDCGIPYPEGRRARHVGTFTHRSAVATRQAAPKAATSPRKAKPAPKAATSPRKAKPAPKAATSPRKAKPAPKAATSPAAASETFGERMARLAREKKAAANGSG